MTEICKETGVVRKTSGETAEVAVERTHDCGGCKACIFSRSGKLYVTARNPAGARAGDRVALAVNKSSGMSLLATIVALGIPLALMAASVVVCAVADLAEWVNLLVSVGALALGFLIVWLADKFARKTRMCAEITEILPAAETAAEPAAETSPGGDQDESERVK